MLKKKQTKQSTLQIEIDVHNCAIIEIKNWKCKLYDAFAEFILKKCPFFIIHHRMIIIYTRGTEKFIGWLWFNGRIWPK